jgi:hypothetical protein
MATVSKHGFLIAARLTSLISFASRLLRSERSGSAADDNSTERAFFIAGLDLRKGSKLRQGGTTLLGFPSH